MSLLLTPSPCAKESHALLVLAAVVNWTSRSYIRIAALSITSAIRLHTVKHVLLQYTHTRGAGEGPARAPVLVPAQQESDAASAPGAHPAALLFVIIVLAAGGGRSGIHGPVKCRDLRALTSSSRLVCSWSRGTCLYQLQAAAQRVLCEEL
ncbi:hypothetical protein HDV57DRAFT_510624 [Trichoderma longibrachiatum]